MRRKEGPSFYLNGFQRNKSTTWTAGSTTPKSVKSAPKQKRPRALQAVVDESDEDHSRLSAGCYDDDDFDDSDYPRGSCSSYGEPHRLQEIKQEEDTIDDHVLR